MLRKSLFLSAFIFFQTATVVRAVNVPEFPTCSNPQGTLKVSFDTGTHGIVGNPGEFKGSDKVYTVDETRTVQCFCSTDGSAIQTNWWKVSSLSQDEVQTLKNLGWIFVPNGLEWGLEAQSYMALNTSYSCASSNGGTGGSSTSNSSSTNNGTGGAVLGLATTGNTLLLATLPTISILSFLLGLSIRKV